MTSNGWSWYTVPTRNPCGLSDVAMQAPITTGTVGSNECEGERLSASDFEVNESDITDEGDSEPSDGESIGTSDTSSNEESDDTSHTADQSTSEEASGDSEDSISTSDTSSNEESDDASHTDDQSHDDIRGSTAHDSDSDCDSEPDELDRCEAELKACRKRRREAREEL